MDEKYIEYCMFKTIFLDKNYLTIVISSFEPEFFDSTLLEALFTESKKYFEVYKDVPTREIILHSIAEDLKTPAEIFFKEIDSLDFDVSRNYEWLVEQTNIYLKNKAIKSAIIQSIEIIERKQEKVPTIRSLVEKALSKDIKIDLGLDYFEELGPRLHNIFTNTERRVPLGFPLFDEFINGGLPPYTLSVFVGRVHGFKSNIMVNSIARQCLMGYNVAIASLEMSEKMFAQRFDSIYSNLDINRMYTNTELRKKLVQKLQAVKSRENRGQLFIKELPTGKATVNDFRMWLRELSLRGKKPDIFYFDYLNLMSSEEKTTDSTYINVKRISEETRALGLEFDIPMVSVTQLNRAGSFMNLSEVDFTSVSESMGTVATSDLMVVMGNDPERMTYENEVHYKIVKNRLGGRVGEIGKFYFDSKSLKMYDESEEDLWLKDVEETGDHRNVYESEEPRRRK